MFLQEQNLLSHLCWYVWQIQVELLVIQSYSHMRKRKDMSGGKGVDEHVRGRRRMWQGEGALVHHKIWSPRSLLSSHMMGFHEVRMVSLETSSKGLGAVLVMSLAHLYRYVLIHSLLHSHQITLRDPNWYASKSSHLLPHLSPGQQVSCYHRKTQKVRVSRCLRTLYR